MSQSCEALLVGSDRYGDNESDASDEWQVLILIK